MVLSFAVLGVLAASFALDLATPLGVAGGVPHVLAVVLSTQTRRPTLVAATGMTACLLTLAGWGLSAPLGLPWIVTLNRIYALVAIVASAAVGALWVRSQATLDGVIEGIPHLVWRSDTAGRWNWASGRWASATGVQQPEGLGWLAAVHPEDRDGVLEECTKATAAHPPSMELRVWHLPTREYRWFCLRADAVAEPGGPPAGWLGTLTDVTEVRRLRDEQRTLVAELHHRTRNLITVVDAIATETFQSAHEPAQLLPALRSRLRALSHAQQLLSRTNSRGVTVDALIHKTLAATIDTYQPRGRMSLRGERDIELPAWTVQALTLALHELGTNATKHGALALEGGHLDLAWRMEQDERGQTALVEWIERWPAETTTRDRRNDTERGESGGYGLELIREALPYQLGAKVSWGLDAAGLRCAIALPLVFREQPAVAE